MKDFLGEAKPKHLWVLQDDLIIFCDGLRIQDECVFLMHQIDYFWQSKKLRVLIPVFKERLCAFAKESCFLKIVRNINLTNGPK